MDINLSGHHVDLTPALRDYVQEKFDRVVRHCEQITSIQVILSVDNLDQKAESTVRVAGSDELFAEAVTQDMYASIDALADKIDRIVKKIREKNTEKNRGQKARLFEQ